MNFFVAITDYDWFQLHASKPVVEEVNFWRPSSDASFRALQMGEPFLFKLHSPRNYIVGGGFFTKFLTLPVSLAWEAFGEGNGATSLDEVKQRISKYRHVPISVFDDPNIGCIILAEPFFFPEEEWIPSPPDFSKNIVVGKTYAADSAEGAPLWTEVTTRLERQGVVAGSAMEVAIEGPRYGKPTLIVPRLGQGSFRVLVTDAYNRRCAMTQERTLPVLEAAHIKPYAAGGQHELPNGLCLRSDLHKLFDHGYITVDPDERRIVVSKRIREEFENGRDYYQLNGRVIATPSDALAVPSADSLRFHAENVFR
jgi:putative restriction endonuclease